MQTAARSEPDYNTPPDGPYGSGAGGGGGGTGGGDGGTGGGGTGSGGGGTGSGGGGTGGGGTPGNPNPLGDAAPVINALTDEVGGLVAAGTDALGNGKPLDAIGAVLGSLTSVGSNLVEDLQAALEGTVSSAGNTANGILQAVADVGDTIGLGNEDGSSSLLSAILGLPGAALDGNAAQGIDDVNGEAGNTLGAAGGVANAIAGAVADPLDAVPGGDAGGLVHDITGSIGSGPLLDTSLLDPEGDGSSLINAQVNPGASQNGALIQLDAAGDGLTSQSNNLVDAGAGPRDLHQGSVKLLDPAPGHNQGTAELNVLNVGQDGPKLVDADVATDDHILDYAALPGSTGAISLLEPLELFDGTSEFEAVPAIDLADAGLPALPALLPNAQPGFDLLA
jgi:hypothetical protein